MAAFIADVFHLEAAPAEEQSELLELCEELRLQRIAGRKAREAYEARAGRISLTMSTDEERSEINALKARADLHARCMHNVTDMISEEMVTTTEEAVAKLFVARAHSTVGATKCEDYLLFVLLDDVIGFLRRQHPDVAQLMDQRVSTTISQANA